MNHSCTYAVKAKDIPEVQQEYTDLWELVKRFYQIPPLGDMNYWDCVVEEVHLYYKKHPTPNAKGLAIHFLEELERRTKELYGAENN